MRRANGNGDDTASIHSSVQSQGGDGSAPRRPHDPGDRSQARGSSESGERLGSGQAQAGLQELFAGASNRRQKDHDATIHDLHAAKIGELTVERDFYHVGSGTEPAERMLTIEREHAGLSLTRQCRPAGTEPVVGILPTGGRERADAGVDAAHRRVVPAVSVLRPAVRWCATWRARGYGLVGTGCGG